MELLREIITPTSNEYVLSLPDEMIGKQVEVVAYEVENPQEEIRGLSQEEKISQIQKIFENSLVDLSNFKFDRDEANNYDE